jgi:glutathione S-transferase
MANDALPSDQVAEFTAQTGAATITVHHLNQSRSQRILWLLEELSLPYTIAFYERDAHNMAPASLRSIHPLGKSPIVTEGDQVIAESGAIIDYIIRHHGKGRLCPDPAAAAYDNYLYWLHYAEGSAVTPFVIMSIVEAFGAKAAPLKRRVDFEMNLNLSFINQALAGKDYLLGNELTGADIQMSFVGELAAAGTNIAQYPNIDRWVATLQARDAYKAAVERGGHYKFQR